MKLLVLCLFQPKSRLSHEGEIIWIELLASLSACGQLMVVGALDSLSWCASRAL